MAVVGGRAGRWWSGWRLAVRIARRDARRHKGSTVLVAVMVGLPVLLLAAGATVLATEDLTDVEAIPRAMGAGQARVVPLGAGTQIVQTQDVNVTNTVERPVRPVRGHTPGEPWTAAQVQSVTGGHVFAVAEGGVAVRLGDRRLSLSALGIDGREPATSGMVALRSGRWPRTPSEVLATPSGIERGLPQAGAVTAVPSQPGGGPSRRLQVVGVAEGLMARGGKAGLVTLPGALEPEQAQTVFVVADRSPVAWPEVRQLNEYGLAVESREVLHHPPTPDQVDPALTGQRRNQSGQQLVLLLAAVGIFIETALLAGPAFAVTAARQRRAVALAASNGAGRAQLRRYVLALALVLGVATATVATATGIGLASVLLTAWAAIHPAFDTGPFDVPGGTLAGVLACAVCASLLAAAIPARGMGRLELVSALRGRFSPGRPRRGLPALGALLMGASGAAILLVAAGRWRLDGNNGDVAIAGGALGLVAGALLLIPMLMGLLARGGSRLPLPVRMATRDSFRQRGRSAPTVAAIMAAVAALTAVGIGAASRSARNDADYTPQLPMGVARVMGNDDAESLREVRTVVATQAPRLTLRMVGGLFGQDAEVGSGATRRLRSPVVVVRHPGCTPADMFRGVDDLGAPLPRCSSVGTNGAGAQPGVVVVDADTLARLMPLPSTARRVLAGGGMLVADPALLSNGGLEVIEGHVDMDPTGAGAPTRAVVDRQRHVPALAVDPATWRTAFPDLREGAAVTPGTAASLGWPTGGWSSYLFSPTGTVSAAEETAISEHLSDTAMLYVERGFHDDRRTVLLIIFTVTGLLVLVAALVATALSLSESRADMATLAAVGATRHTRRLVAGSQALVVGLVGCVLGLAVGMVPGLAITWPLTAHTLDPVTHLLVPAPVVISIPWVHLVAVTLGVPVLAALLAAAAVRRAPTVTRRVA